MRRSKTGKHFAFQPTLPARGATALANPQRSGEDISTHAPRTGSDPVFLTFPDFCKHFNPRSPHGERQWFSVDKVLPSKDFNPRSPHGERRLPRLFQNLRNGISTHAPRTGSDDIVYMFIMFPLRFQPTLPARGATSSLVDLPYTNDISTHAPRTGSDRHFVP